MQNLKAIPIVSKIAKLDNVPRSQLIQVYRHYKKTCDEWIKRQIINNNRIDLLCSLFLDLEISPFHFTMQQFTFNNQKTLQLAPRQHGKTSTVTIPKCIHYLIKNPNFKILIGSKTIGNAKGFLKEITGHLEGNKELNEMFGPFFDNYLIKKQGKKWNDSEIEILSKERKEKESSITCVGVDSTIVSKHYDAILSDDLIDMKNSQTALMREKVEDWYYQVYYPVLKNADGLIQHRGEHHVLGTRYHYEDLYGHFIENEMKNTHKVYPALNKKGQSLWARRPSEILIEKRKEMGPIRFGCQYMNSVDLMKGEIFNYDLCQPIDDTELPPNLRYFMGIDLAIGQEEVNDEFAIVIVGKDKFKNFYVVDNFSGHLRFTEQTTKIVQYYKKWKPVRALIETNGYQKAQYSELKKKHPDMRLVHKSQNKDKTARAWKLSAIFEDKRMFFLKAGNYLDIIEHLVLIKPDRHKQKDDLFDALDLAVRASKLRKKKKRRNDFGLLGA